MGGNSDASSDFDTVAEAENGFPLVGVTREARAAASAGDGDCRFNLSFLTLTLPPPSSSLSEMAENHIDFNVECTRK